MATAEMEPEVETEVETEIIDQLPERKEKQLANYRDVSHRLVGLNQQLKGVDAEIKGIKDDLKDAKEHRESLISSITQRLSDLSDIENGQYQPSLFAGQDNEESNDPAFGCPIFNLGMTEKENEILISTGIKTIADLEKQMRENEWWHSEIKGFGQAKVDKLSDNLTSWRMRNPVPSEDDEIEDEDKESEEENTIFDGDENE